MMILAKDKPVVTIINVHNCDPENQERLYRLLSDGTNVIHRHVPGFVAATLHRSPIRACLRS
jgi:phosphoribosylamine-glycine ligase